MKPITDRVFKNPLTSLVGVLFAAAGLWLLKWSDDLAEPTRVIMSIICLGLAITGLGWTDKTLIKLVRIFRGTAKMLALIGLTFIGSSCVSNRHILKELESITLILKQQKDANLLYYYEQQNKEIDDSIESMSNNQLFETIESILTEPSTTRSKRKN